jgi:hypothetical protein
LRENYDKRPSIFLIQSNWILGFLIPSTKDMSKFLK